MRAVLVATFALAPLNAAFAEASAGDAARGVKLFKQRCGLCHSVAPDGAAKPGPSLKGVVNRKAGQAAGFNYSPALKTAKITWTPPKLERYLAAPSKAVPGTFMMAAVASPAERADIIAYLRTAK